MGSSESGSKSTLALTIPGCSCTVRATPRWWVVPTRKTPWSRKCLRIALAKAEPSSGSVLVPNSSTNTKEWLVARSMMEMRLLMWELNVERDCWMLC